MGIDIWILKNHTPICNEQRIRFADLTKSGTILSVRFSCRDHLDITFWHKIAGTDRDINPDNNLFKHYMVTQKDSMEFACLLEQCAICLDSIPESISAVVLLLLIWDQLTFCVHIIMNTAENCYTTMHELEWFTQSIIYIPTLNL